MAYEKTNWVDHVVDPGEIDPATGQPKVIQQGTRFTAARANKIEKGIEDAHIMAESLARELGGSFVASPPGSEPGFIFSSFGLTASWTAGIGYVNGVRFEIQAGSIELNATQGQYIYLDTDGVIKKTTSQATVDAKLPLWYFATDASQVITSIDRRKAVNLSAFLKVGTTNLDVNFVQAIIQQADTRTIVLTYTNGDLTRVEEKDGTTVVKATDLTYTSGKLTKVRETVGGKTITQTLNYDANDNLTSVASSVV